MKRNLQLDFLRFMGVILVVIHHVPFHDTTIFGAFISVIQTGGWAGVDLFFVLSGYLIAGLIIKEYEANQTFNIRLFLIRRGFKIYPAYYFYLIYQFWYSANFAKYPQQLNRFFHEVFFLTNYTKNNNGHLWSISVEEHFYVLLAITFVVLIKLKKVNLKSMLELYLALLAVGVFFRTYNFFIYHNYNFDRDYTPSHLRFDAMFFGVLIAFVANYRKQFMQRVLSNKYRPLYFILCLLFISTNFIYGRWDTPWQAIISLSLNPICFGYIMVCLMDYNNPTFLKIIKPLSYIGAYSYSIYLFHIHFLVLSLRLYHYGLTVFYISYVAFAFIGGIIVSKAIEYPFLKIRERYFPNRYKLKKVS
jgi:peptidoglycan/LPS O-acetylase OafA/YrhL